MKPEQVTQDSESAVSKLSRDEILASSRAENKDGDERERQQYGKANTLGFAVGLLVASVIIIVKVVMTDVFPAEILLLTCSMQAAQSIVIGATVRSKRKLYIIIGITEAILAVFFLVFWILQMCGIA